MLEAYDLIPYKNCINVSYDELGGLYEIPNYCVHDPMVYDLPEDPNDIIFERVGTAYYITPEVLEGMIYGVLKLF